MAANPRRPAIKVPGGKSAAKADKSPVLPISIAVNNVANSHPRLVFERCKARNAGPTK
ncbi:hypothetical protein GF312_11280 [Candidatus Poribacteria bacterium]|nr:hypothetical protein [Candidatus Poribacteria bacterium]